MHKHLPQWIEGLYDFIFILAVCVFGFGVQIGYMYLRDKILKRKKVVIWFLVNLSVSFFLNVLMKKMGMAEWTWIAVWFYNANSFWLLEVVGGKAKTAFESAVPAIILSWTEKLKAKNPPKDDRDKNT